MSFAIDVLVQPEHGQDAAASVATTDGVLLVVADGAGGVAGGRRASGLVIAECRAIAAIDSEPNLLEFLHRVDQHLLADQTAGLSTAVVACLSSRHLYGASVGDSEAWLISPHDVVDLTQHQQRKPLLGSGLAVPVPFVAALPGNGTLLLGSDGLFKYAKRKSILAMVRQRGKDSAGSLIDLARLPNADLPDDVSVIVCTSETR